MQRTILLPVVVASLGGSLLMLNMGVQAMPPDKPSTGQKQPENVKNYPATTEDEARGRARLLHETLHATLQVVHDEYYRPDERLTLPAATLERVFRELAARQNVKLRWLAVNAQAMNVNHAPQDEFEKNSVTALTAGQDEFERVEHATYRYTGAITLSSACLKCHLPGRTSNKDRVAALVISIPLSAK